MSSDVTMRVNVNSSISSRMDESEIKTRSETQKKIDYEVVQTDELLKKGLKLESIFEAISNINQSIDKAQNTKKWSCYTRSVQRCVLNKEQRVFFAVTKQENQNKIVGYIVIDLTEENPNIAYLATDLKGNGIGSVLLKTVFQIYKNTHKFLELACEDHVKDFYLKFAKNNQVKYGIDKDSSFWIIRYTLNKTT